MGKPTQTSRTLPFALVVIFGLCFASVSTLMVTPQPAVAQEEVAEGGGEGQDAPKKEGSNRSVFDQLWHILKASFPVWAAVFGLLSIALVAIAVVLVFDMRMGIIIPPGFVDEFTDLVNKRQFKPAFDLCRGDNSFLARVLTAGMSRLQYGIEDSRHAALNMVDGIRAGKEQLINYLGTIGTLGPMIGLIGTVWGMIGAFMELGGGGAPKVSQLASDISEALVTTFMGVAIALVAIFFHAFYRNRLTRLTMDTSNLADDLLTQMYHNSRKPGAPAPTTAAVVGGNANAQAVKPAE